MGVPASVGEPRFKNRVTAASTVITPVTIQPRAVSSGPKSATGTSGPGLTSGSTRSAGTTAADSRGGAVISSIVGCRS
ncbi:Uncharacterised protein [Mycobacterium tuberculosis]|nr:Uncharacterised protein [Mycobacterium tuberculosis]